MTEEPKDPAQILREVGEEIKQAAARTNESVSSALQRFAELAREQMPGLIGGASATPPSVVIPELPPLRPLRASQQADGRVRLANSGDSASEPFSLEATDLVSDAGDHIPATAVVLADHQRVVAAGLTDTAPVTMAVPEGTAPGIYRGELRPSVDTVAAVPLEVHVQ